MSNQLSITSKGGSTLMYSGFEITELKSSICSCCSVRGKVVVKLLTSSNLRVISSTAATISAYFILIRGRCNVQATAMDILLCWC